MKKDRRACFSAQYRRVEKNNLLVRRSAAERRLPDIHGICDPLKDQPSGKYLDCYTRETMAIKRATSQSNPGSGVKGSTKDRATQELSPTATQFAELERLLSLCEVQAVRSGVPYPLGAQVRRNGINFAIFSRHAAGIRHDLFDHPEDSAPARTFILDAARNKTGDIWHVWLEGVQPGQLYGFRVTGPYLPDAGHRFNPAKLLVDPYATALAPIADRDYRAAF